MKKLYLQTAPANDITTKNNQKETLFGGKFLQSDRDGRISACYDMFPKDKTSMLGWLFMAEIATSRCVSRQISAEETTTTITVTRTMFIQNDRGAGLAAQSPGKLFAITANYLF